VSGSAFPGLEQAREPWSRLAAETGNVFSTWEWASTWWRHFGAGRQLRLTLVGDADDPEAILPLVLERHAGIPVLRFLGHGVADQLGPVCGSSALNVAMRSLAAAPCGTAILLAERLPGQPDWAKALAGRLLKQDQSPIIDLSAAGGWNDYLAARSANFRQQVRRRARRLERLGLRFRLSFDPDRLERDLDALMALHHARWGVRSRAFAPARARFHREFAAVALERGWLRLWIAEAEGEPVAAWYGFRFGGIESFYQSGRDPTWDRFQVGAGLLEQSIREAFADGMTEYRLLRGDEVYKARYTTADPGLATVAAARGLPGRIMVSLAARVAANPAARRVLTRQASLRPSLIRGPGCAGETGGRRPASR
jgi:CelD/BcsL family acetyltransferase involved in cellulose biosynthesis